MVLCAVGPAFRYGVAEQAKQSHIPDCREQKPDAAAGCGFEWHIQETENNEACEVDGELFGHVVERLAS